MVLPGCEHFLFCFAAGNVSLKCDCCIDIDEKEYYCLKEKTEDLYE
jgi:hypothetical protein